MAYTQTNRHLAISTPLGDDALLLRSVSGVEAISQLFHFDLDLLSENDSIDFEGLVGKNVTLRILDSDAAERHWNGFISRFSQGSQDRRFTTYRAQMVPWLWFLTRTADCRIFQNKNVPDIIQSIFSELGFQDFELRLYGEFAARDYCVQYRETDLNFLSRLMEEEGIFYFFRHEEKKHVLVLANDPAAHLDCPGQATAQYDFRGGRAVHEDVITEWRHEQEFRPGGWAQTDYNFETPSTDLAVRVNGTNRYEIYDYPGDYGARAEGDRLARIRFEEQSTPGVVMQGAGGCRHFTCGHKFTLEDHYRKALNQPYLLTAVHHTATQGGDYEAGSSEGEEFTYRNSFECIPFSTPFRPPRVAPRPIVRGCQTAVVVGPAGQEIHTDKYGRVKVQFHWDREGKRDENSSCWIRVSHPWAGKGYGSLAIPRIGHEVIVDFVEGNPDQPIITGRVYNAEQMPATGLPAAGMVSGFKSNSTPGGGGHNEMSMDDTKGKEKITIHAQYDMDTTVKHNDTQTIETGDRKITIKTGKHTETIKGDTALTVETGNHSLTVQTGKHSETIKGDTAVIVQTGTYKLDVQTGTHTHHAAGKVTENYDAGQATEVTGGILIKAKTLKITLDAADEIFLVCGDSKLSLAKNGTIKMDGKDIDISAGNSAKLGVDSQNVICDKQKVATSGAAINSSAVGMHEITGALVKIN